MPLLLKHVSYTHSTISCLLAVSECSHHAISSGVSHLTPGSLPLLCHIAALINSPSLRLGHIFILIIKAVLILRLLVKGLLCGLQISALSLPSALVIAVGVILLFRVFSTFYFIVFSDAL